MNKELKKQAMSDLKFVEKILQRWDPIGVIDDLKESGLPPDEYDSYAPSILTMLNRGANLEDIASHLGQIQSVNMGLGGPWPEKDNQTAQEIISWWQTRNI
jgi:hypothetical protein